MFPAIIILGFLAVVFIAIYCMLALAGRADDRVPLPTGQQKAADALSKTLSWPADRLKTPSANKGKGAA